MYNRYTSQPDGSFRRRTVPDPVPPPQTRRQEPSAPAEPPQKAVTQPSGTKPTYRFRKSPGFFSFLPKGIDAGDLLVIALLLLIAEECPDKKDSALLTLAMYFIL